MADTPTPPRILIAGPDGSLAQRLRREGVAFQVEPILRPSALPSKAIIQGELSAIEVARLGGMDVRVLWGEEGRAASGIVLPNEVLETAQHLVVSLPDERLSARAEEVLRRPGRTVRREPSAARRFTDGSPDEGALLVARLSVPEADRLGMPYIHCEPTVPGDPEAGLSFIPIVVSLSANAAGLALRDAAVAASVDPEADRRLMEARRGLGPAAAAAVMGDALDAHLRGAFARLAGKQAKGRT